VRVEEEAKFLRSETPGLPVLGLLPADQAVQEADRLGIPVYDHAPLLKQVAKQMAYAILSLPAPSRLEPK
jgi:hypothetical protein